jgi:hypothetical protein
MNERSFTTPSDQAGTDEANLTLLLLLLLLRPSCFAWQETLSFCLFCLVFAFSSPFLLYRLFYMQYCEWHGGKQKTTP